MLRPMLAYSTPTIEVEAPNNICECIISCHFLFNVPRVIRGGEGPTVKKCVVVLARANSHNQSLLVVPIFMPSLENSACTRGIQV